MALHSSICVLVGMLLVAEAHRNYMTGRVSLGFDGMRDEVSPAVGDSSLEHVNTETKVTRRSPPPIYFYSIGQKAATEQSDDGLTVGGLTQEQDRVRRIERRRLRAQRRRFEMDNREKEEKERKLTEEEDRLEDERRETEIAEKERMDKLRKRQEELRKQIADQEKERDELEKAREVQEEERRREAEQREIEDQLERQREMEENRKNYDEQEKAAEERRMRIIEVEREREEKEDREREEKMREAEKKKQELEEARRLLEEERRRHAEEMKKLEEENAKRKEEKRRIKEERKKLKEELKRRQELVEKEEEAKRRREEEERVKAAEEQTVRESEMQRQEVERRRVLEEKEKMEQEYLRMAKEKERLEELLRQREADQLARDTEEEERKRLEEEEEQRREEAKEQKKAAKAARKKAKLERKRLEKELRERALEEEREQTVVTAEGTEKEEQVLEAAAAFQAKRIWHAQRYREKLQQEKEKLEAELRSMEKSREQGNGIEMEVDSVHRQQTSRLEGVKTLEVQDKEGVEAEEDQGKSDVVTFGKPVVVAPLKRLHKIRRRIITKPISPPATLDKIPDEEEVSQVKTTSPSMVAPLPSINIHPMEVEELKEDNGKNASKAYLDAYYTQYYKEWYRKHNMAALAIPTSSSKSATTPMPARQIKLQIGNTPPPAPLYQVPAAPAAPSPSLFGSGVPTPPQSGNFYGILDPRVSGQAGMTKEQLDVMCISIRNVTKAFGIRDPKAFATNNCNIIRMSFPTVTCEQIVHVMEYCEPVLSPSG